MLVVDRKSIGSAQRLNYEKLLDAVKEKLLDAVEEIQSSAPNRTSDSCELHVGLHVHPEQLEEWKNKLDTLLQSRQFAHFFPNLLKSLNRGFSKSVTVLL
jgi:hypothetical protein